MTLLHEAVEQKKYDVRLVERNMARNSVTQAEVDQYVKGLPDDSQNALYVSVDSLMEDLLGDSDEGSTH